MARQNACKSGSGVSSCLCEVADSLKKGNYITTLKTGKKEDPQNYKLVSLTSRPGKSPLTSWMVIQSALSVCFLGNSDLKKG